MIQNRLRKRLEYVGIRIKQPVVLKIMLHYNCAINDTSIVVSRMAIKVIKFVAIGQ